MSAALRYSRTVLLLDYGRAALGAGLSGAVLAAPISPAMSAVAAGLTALFGAFALRTAVRQITRFKVSPTAIAATGWRTVALDWAELDRLRMRYYGPRRKRAKGWVTLSLRARGKRISVDSTLPEFEHLASLAAAAARRNGVALDDVTLGNLAALDLLPAAPAGQP